MNKYLLEIGTEELPYKFIPSAIEQLKTGIEKALEENKVEYSNIKTFATPRRLTIIIEGLPLKQEDVEKVIKGPISNIAYDENGNLTKAALGFANKNGVDTTSLFKQDNYIWAKVKQKGKETKDILKEIMPISVLKLKGSHFMRWADLNVKFQRPIRWIVSLFNEENLEIEITDVKSSDISRGHRFKSDSVKIKNADSYEDALYSANVIVDSEKRKSVIRETATKKAQEIGAEIVMDEELLDEVTYLTEWPVPVLCEFEEKYLAIPEKVTVTVMASHQRYFPLYKDGKLLNKFITMTNYISDSFDNIRAGNERVVKARLEDAIFFFKEDTQKPLIEYLEELKGITFQKGLGSVYDKTLRVVELSKYLADKINVDSADIERTAILCKADLATSLVFEFTELQGFIGCDYATISKENPQVAKGIKEHYFPLNAESELASEIEGQIVGIADKIDTIVAVFADGKKVTGSQDPLGVRRATLGILKTIIAKGLNINLVELIEKSINLLPIEIKDKTALLAEIKEFFEQRLIILYSENYRYDVVEACISEKNVLSNLKDFTARLNVVEELVKIDNYGKFHEAINRIIRIIKNDNACQSPDHTLFNTQAESDLWACMSSVDADKLNYTELKNELIKSADVINEFFDKVLVMDNDEKIKQNRVNLLSFTKNIFNKIADFSKIVH